MNAGKSACAICYHTHAQVESGQAKQVALSLAVSSLLQRYTRALPEISKMISLLFILYLSAPPSPLFLFSLSESQIRSEIETEKLPILEFEPSISSEGIAEGVWGHVVPGSFLSERTPPPHFWQ